MANTSVSLSDHFTAFIGDQVRTGSYSSASDVVRAGLRMLEAHEERRKALHLALQDGLDSGVADEFDEEEFLERMRARYGAKV